MTAGLRDEVIVAKPPFLESADSYGSSAATGRCVDRDLHDVPKKIDGEIAFPMGSRGRLLGVIVLGPQTSGEAFAPDEIEAVAICRTASASHWTTFGPQMEATAKESRGLSRGLRSPSRLSASR